MPIIHWGWSLVTLVEKGAYFNQWRITWKNSDERQISVVKCKNSVPTRLSIGDEGFLRECSVDDEGALKFKFAQTVAIMTKRDGRGRIDTYEVERIVKAASLGVCNIAVMLVISEYSISVWKLVEILQTSSSCRVAKASECNEGSVRIKRKLCRSKDIIWIINCLSGCCSLGTKIVDNLLSKEKIVSLLW